MSDRELAAVLALPAPKRYQYFVKRVADAETVWSLGGPGGWVLLSDAEEHEVVPVWPHQRFAAACATGKWADNEPRPILLSDWLSAWLPGIARDGRGIAVFPTPDDGAAVVTSERLKADLEEELRNYE